MVTFASGPSVTSRSELAEVMAPSVMIRLSSGRFSSLDLPSGPTTLTRTFGGGPRVGHGVLVARPHLLEGLEDLVRLEGGRAAPDRGEAHVDGRRELAEVVLEEIEGQRGRVLREQRPRDEDEVEVRLARELADRGREVVVARADLGGPYDRELDGPDRALVLLLARAATREHEKEHRNGALHFADTASRVSVTSVTPVLRAGRLALRDLPLASASSQRVLSTPIARKAQTAIPIAATPSMA
jgi:hypothetical protein